MCRGTALTNPNKGKWFKFNDTLVEEFDMNDQTVEQECFGGAYRAKVYDSSKFSLSLIWACTLRKEHLLW